jgi:hypothetical protein
MKTDMDLFGNPVIKDPLLRDKFIEPPFSVLDTKTSHWMKRKRQWKKLGLESHLGRDGVCVLSNSFANEKYGRKDMPEVSIFDPALCELMYNWFCDKGGLILDPFAGGSVRGIVANYLGFKYTGIDIRKEQVEANILQAKKICHDNMPIWYIGDSNILLDSDNVDSPFYMLSDFFDMVFTCPPYHNLEVYSDLEGDISNKDYNEFINIYTSIISKSIKLLKKGKYAVFVVSDIRDEKGYYRDFISDTKKAFISSGAKLYNEAILLQPLGTAMLRANRIFSSNCKLVKVHEHILIFKKV